jgi:hypothetical protein
MSLKVIKKFMDFILISQFHPSPYRLIHSERARSCRRVENWHILFLLAHQICLNDNRRGPKAFKKQYNLFWRGLTMVLTNKLKTSPMC